MVPDADSLKGRLKDLAEDLGFAACRICRADEPWQAGERLEAYVSEGRHGQMAWMELSLIHI